MKKLACSLFLVLLSFSASADEIYKIQSEVVSNNKNLGDSTIITYANEKTKIEGDNFKLSTLLKENEDSSITLNTKLNIGSKEFSPTIVLALNEWASVSANNIELRVKVSKEK